ncbi:cytochrome C biogenesis protein [Photobacterium sp. NCIMB 13483]|uniref:Divalent-cation tolerance protein CutA n=1 Tax=Photobacterium piscicola TaxID=1378299 RepID=A0ABU6LLT5_9GAMM|nr:MULTISPECIES: divalent-cation tolerance protein CutA [Photobacterium]MEC6823700.1 divalent-cation tolerance protein CutA [Photobacterium piscicola]MEC6882080.1 divalent-cation tolerance protein CutA [Photobacterium piscicola]MEC6899598.1 divalent-cation tolerance protein CutA [Photobacterium piscicola]PST94334.1 cytochrome C biogenesis protein [Photobacterium sp. NCIMB 13483]
MTNYCVIVTTFSDDENGQTIINALLEQRLAACIQVMPIKSYYHWKQKINCDQEQQIIIKTKTNLFEQVQAIIVKHHLYETPEIIQLPITKGSVDYLSWIDQTCM